MRYVRQRRAKNEISTDRKEGFGKLIQIVILKLQRYRCKEM